jgi:hypothetical protein
MYKNQIELTDQIVQNITRAISNSKCLLGKAVEDALWNSYNDELEKIQRNIRTINKFVCDLFEIFKQSSDCFLDLSEDPAKLVTSTKKILKQVRAVSQAQIFQKRKLLAYSIMDDNGHTIIGVVSEKNLDPILQLPDYYWDGLFLVDKLYYYPDIFKQMGKILGHDFWEEGCQKSAVEEYAKYLISNKDVDL